jgi:hypothetical protein
VIYVLVALSRSRSDGRRRLVIVRARGMGSDHDAHFLVLGMSRLAIGRGFLESGGGILVDRVDAVDEGLWLSWGPVGGIYA